MSTVKVTAENFEAEVLQSEQPVVVDFWAEWCMPCKMFAPILEEVSEQLAGQAKIAKLDVDANMELSRKYKVLGIPTIILFKNGEIAKQHSGVLENAELTEWITSGL